MNPVILIDGEEQSKISIFNRNVQYGDGLFETCISKKNKILFWQRHLDRLNLGCERLDIKKVQELAWKSDLKKAFALSSVDDCIVKIILSRGDSLRGYGYKKDITPVRIVIISEKKKSVDHDLFSLEFSDSGFYSNPNLAGIKHCNRLEQILARSNLLSDEAIMQDENGNVISVSQGNIYLICDGKLLTPKLDRCGVEGSRRSLIMDLARSLGIDTEECLVSSDKLRQADEVFISNSVIGIQSVSSIEEFSFGNNPLTAIIKSSYEAKINESNSWTCL